MEEADILIIGAGVVGLAVAARLARANNTVVLLESNPRYGMETSSRNSEVVHAGLYYPAGTWKNKLCHQGRSMLYELCPKNGVFIRKTGKLVVATRQSELPALEKLRSSAEAAGAQGLRMFDGAQARRRIPGLKACAALWSPESGIIDSEGLMGYFHSRAQEGRAILLFNAPISRITPVQEGYEAEFAGQSVRARWVVNAAGLFSDRVAALAGLDVDAVGYRLHWCKGSYFRVRRSTPVPCLIYPLPGQHSLGVHVTVDQRGMIRLGPDAQFVDSLDYNVDPSRAPDFHQAVSRYLDGIALENLFPDTSGIRPKLSGPGGGFRDFVIAEESGRGLPRWINLCGIESPGLTASPAIAEEVARIMEL